MLKRMMAYAVATAVAGGTVAGPALAAGGPPAPTATNGAKVSLVAAGLSTPTAFAFGAGTLFEGDAGSQPSKPGGVYHLSGGKATLLAGSPQFVTGVTFSKGTLYVAGGFFGAGAPTFRILAWSGWNGTRFRKQKSIYTAPKGFQSFNGLAVGPDGRLFVGVDLGEANDHSPAKTPYVYDILTMTTAGKGLKVFATGIRQPWQFAFAPGDSAPFVTNFGQDKGLKNPPDSLLHVKKGDNYGFPQCGFASGQKCKGFAKPYKLYAPHTDNGGIAIVGGKIYLGQFGFAAPLRPAGVTVMPLKGGKAKTIVKSAVPVMAIAANGGYLYIGTGSGFVYRTKL